MTEEMRKHYLEYGPFTYPGLYEEYFRSLPDDPSELGHLISHQIIHRVTLRVPGRHIPHGPCHSRRALQAGRARVRPRQGRGA